MLVDEFLELLHLRQRKALLYRSGYGADARACRNGKGHVVGISRLGHDDFISGIEARHEGEEHRLRAAGCDDDVVGRKADIVFRIIVREFLAIGTEALARAVLQDAAVDVLQRVEACLRRGQVGLADIEVVDMNAPILGSRCQRRKLADRRLGHFHASV